MLTIISMPHRRRRFGLGFAALLLLALPAEPASAAVDGAEPLASSGTVPVAKASYARRAGVESLTLDLAAPVGHVAQRDGDQLIIWFDQPQRFDLDALSDRSVSRLVGARAPAEGGSRWLVLDLVPGSRVQSETVDDQRLVISIRGKDDQPAAVTASPTTKTAAPAKEKQGPSVSNAVAAEDVANTAGAVSASASAKTKTHSDDRAGVAAASTTAAPRSAQPRQLIPTAKSAAAKAPVAPAVATPVPPKSAPARAKDAPAVRNASLPGQFEVDETALDRALERTLTREGAVLLPFGMVELEPSFSYVRREFGAPTLINLFGFPAFGETKIRRNDYIAALDARVGLPFDSQLELDLPFSYVDQSVMTTIGFDPVSEVEDDTGAFGDLGVSLAKTVLKESGWWPDVVARLRWDSHTGKSVDNDIALGGGNHELTGSLSFVKSQDPLAFFGSVAYEKTFEEDDLDPGDRIGLAIGTVLAASPETSLRASLRQDFVGDAEFDGDQLDGTDQMVATLNVGASSVLGRGLLLDASAEVGLTDDAPDYSARISLPIRFDLRRTFFLGGGADADDEQDETDGG